MTKKSTAVRVVFTSVHIHDFRPALAASTTYRPGPKPVRVPKAVADRAIADGHAHAAGDGDTEPDPK